VRQVQAAATQAPPPVPANPAPVDPATLWQTAPLSQQAPLCMTALDPARLEPVSPTAPEPAHHEPVSPISPPAESAPPGSGAGGPAPRSAPPLSRWESLLALWLWFALRFPQRMTIPVAMARCVHTLFLVSFVRAHVRLWLLSASTGWIRWTLKRLQAWIEQEFGLRCSVQTVRRILLRLGFSWKKARKLLALACTVQRQQFLQDLRSLQWQSRQGRLLLVYVDEAHIHLEADLPYAWGRRGLPLLVNSISPGLRKVSFYGLYLYNYQAVRIWPYPSANSDYTVDMLTRLRQQFPEHFIVLVWDGASYHRSQLVHDAAAQLGITLIPLPAYSPDLMPVEALWRWLRQEVTYMVCHLSEAELIDDVAEFVLSANLDPLTIATRLNLKTKLDPEEEKLRF
jgi:transposase